jgi:hypothetical protein
MTKTPDALLTSANKEVMPPIPPISGNTLKCAHARWRTPRSMCFTTPLLLALVRGSYKDLVGSRSHPSD